MLGFLKRLVTKSDSSAATAAPAATPARPVAPARPTAPARPIRPEGNVPPRPAHATTAPSSFPRETIPAAKPADTQPAAPVAAAQSVAAEGTVDLPFNPLFSKLPAQVQSLPHHLPASDALLRLPLSLVRTQLARGAVRIPFSQFREFSPSGVFPDSAKGPDFEVEIPLGEIIPKLRPEVIGRRSNQRKIEVPEEIAPLFNSDGKPVEGLKVSDEKSKPVSTAKSAPVQPVAVSANTTLPGSGLPAATPSVKPAAPAVPAPSIPSAGTPAHTPASIPARQVSPTPEPPVEPAVTPRISAPASEPLVNEPIRAPRLDPSLASLKPKAPEPANPAQTPVSPQPQPNLAPAPATPTNEPDFIIAFMDLVSFWTDTGKQELANLYRHSAEIPRNRIEHGLRRGKITFTWREFKPWVKLAPGNSLPTIAEEYEVELPLAIIAPRFFQERHPGKPRRRIAPSDDIPDVFNIKPEAVSPAPPVLEEKTAEPAPAPNPEPVAPVEPPTPAEKPLSYDGIFGKPEKTTWTFSDITENCAALKGVTGALISDSEGLLIAGHWGGEAKADSVAAFVPQMHRRFVEYATELKLGEGGNFTFMLENKPFQILKSGRNFLAILGKPGEVLPDAQLGAVAKCLAQTVQ